MKCCDLAEGGKTDVQEEEYHNAMREWVVRSTAMGKNGHEACKAKQKMTADATAESREREGEKVNEGGTSGAERCA